jgi:glucose/arabinose dehydrogenase
MMIRPVRNFLKFLNILFGGILFSYGQISYEEAFPNISFNVPVEIQNADDGSNRLFVVEQSGTIKVFPNDPGVTSGQVNTFLDIQSKVDFNSGQELGLLGLAFHPNFGSNRYIYVYYTDFPGSYRINISRFQVSASNPNFVDPSTESVILQFTKNQNNSNHNGGKIAFGPDGYLYISVGDGGGSNDPNNNAQNLNSFFGSILRIDVDNPSGGNNYGIPSDNPRLGQSGLDELYAWGIRNTWKFSFDGNTLWGADVGQAQRDEVNIIQNGGNYGWRKFEGDTNGDRFSSTTLATEPHIPPIFSYNYNSGDRSVTGGYVYRGAFTNSLLQGKYIFGDYVSGRVWSLDYNSSNGNATRTELFDTNGQFVSSFGLDESGELYFSDYGNSVKLYKIVDQNSGPVTTAVNGVGAWVNKGVQGTNGSVEVIKNN